MALSKDRLEQLIERSTDIVVATDARGTVIYYNDGARRTLGYAAEEILGKYVVQLYPDKSEAKRVMAAMRGPAHGGPGIVEIFRTTFVSKSGEHIPRFCTTNTARRTARSGSPRTCARSSTRTSWRPWGRSRSVCPTRSTTRWP